MWNLINTPPEREHVVIVGFINAKHKTASISLGMLNRDGQWLVYDLHERRTPAHAKDPDIWMEFPRVPVEIFESFQVTQD